MEKTLVKGLNVLEALVRHSEPSGVAELSEKLGLTRSNTYRLLQTLVATNYVDHDPASGRYTASVKLLELGQLVGHQRDLRSVAAPVLPQIVARTGENACLAVLQGQEVRYIDRVESPQRLRTVVRNDERLPAYASAAGKLLLAFGKPELVEAAARLVAPLTEATLKDAGALRDELDRIRSDDFAASFGEWHPDVSAIAVPLRDRSGDVAAALLIAGPSTRVTAEKRDDFLKALRWGAETIERQLP